MNLDDWFYLIRMGFTPVELPKVRRLPFDPLQYQTEHLERCMEVKGLSKSQIADEHPPPIWPNLQSISDQNLCKPDEVSSSAQQTDVAERGLDYRIQYSYLMSYFLLKVAEQLGILREKSNDPSTVLSMKQLSAIETAIEFFIPTAIRPYVDNGVILHLGKSDLVKHWKPILEDKDFRKKQLKRALETFDALMNSCEAIYNCVVRKYLADYLCLNEQLIELGETGHKKSYEKFLLKVKRPQLITSLFVLLTANNTQPIWLKKALSNHITKLLLLPNGLYHLITATTDGINCFADFGFVKLLSQILVKVPRGFNNKMQYYNTLMRNMFDVLERHPCAKKAAVCFAVVLDLLPKECIARVFDMLLHPWECVLLDSQSGYPWTLGRERYNNSLDSSLRILSLYAESLPPGMHMPFFDRFKALFDLWTLLYASYFAHREEVKGHDAEIKYKNAADAIFSLLRRILHDPSFENVDKKAEFLVSRMEIFEHPYLVEMRYKKVLVEEISETGDLTEEEKFSLIEFLECHNIQKDFMSKPSKPHYEYLSIILTEPDEPKDTFIRFESGILNILRNIEEESSEISLLLSIRTAMCCIQRWAEVVPGSRIAESSKGSMKSEERDSEESNQKVNYFLNDLLSIVLDTEKLSDENLANFIDIPLSILSVVTAKLNVPANEVDVRAALSDDDQQLEETVRNTAYLAIAILNCIVICRQEDIVKFSEHLQRGANILQIFSDIVSKMNDRMKKLYSEHQQSADHMLAFLKANNIEPKNDEPSPSSTEEPLDASNSKKSARNTEVFSLQEILKQLSDESEGIRGHALVMLGKGVAQRNKGFMHEISNFPGIMLEIMRHIVDDDSYVYLHAINAMVKLAYWKQKYFDEMVEFFVDPVGKLKSVLDHKMHNFEEKEKESYLVIQRIKIGEAIAKANKKLGEMAPAYFDRIVNPMLSLMLHAGDDHLRASVISSLSDLIISCRGLNIHKHRSEMLLAAKLFLRDAKTELVRRAAVDLMRAIVRTYDIHIVKEMSLELFDIADCLSDVLKNVDEDTVVKIHAMLCLQDIDAQMQESFSEYEKAHTRRIRF